MNVNLIAFGILIEGFESQISSSVHSSIFINFIVKQLTVNLIEYYII